ncbi:restriction endonuclease subunit S [Bradyrhizobium liaoningense]
MVIEWRSSTIGELCDSGFTELQTGPFGTQLHAYDYTADGIPVVPTEAIRDRQIDHTVLPKISAAKARELGRHRLKKGDILFARRGVQATGHIGFVRDAEEGFICGTGAIRLRINERFGEIDPSYLSHVLANPVSIEWFKFHAIGATMPNLNEGIIRSFPLNLPPPREQRAIAHILGALDDKIELNRRMNETLEAMARALFKSWFLDFDPVRAKAEGRKVSVPQTDFPSSFEDSGLGKIPKGWRVVSLGDVLELAYGKALKEDTRRPGRVAVYGSNGQIGWHEQKLVDGPGIVVGRKGNPGTIVWAPNDFFAIDTTFYVVPKSICMSLYFLYFALRDLGLSSLGADSAVPGLNRNMAYMSRQLVPPKSILDAFDDLVRPLFSRLHSGNEETQTLAALRDTLLPKLISGELRVKAAEKIVEAVA